MVEGCTYCVKNVKSMCPQSDANYTCTRRQGHKGAHFACAGIGYHMLHTWSTGSKLSSAYGMGFCFTGTLAGMSRRAAKIAVKQAGGTAHDSITMAVDYLVVSHNGNNTTKHVTAKTKRIKCISEKEFMTMIAS